MSALMQVICKGSLCLQLRTPAQVGLGLNVVRGPAVCGTGKNLSDLLVLLGLVTS